MVDYPDHLARLNVLRNWNHEPILQQRYEIEAKPFPNLALDLLGVYVFPWLDVPGAGMAILTLPTVLFWAGCHFLGCAAGQPEPVWPAAIAALMMYNSMFLYGFVNYTFGTAPRPASAAALRGTYASLGRNRGDTHTIEWGSFLMKARHLTVWLNTYNARLTTVYALVWMSALAILWIKGRRQSGGDLTWLGAFLVGLAVVFPASRLFTGEEPDARLVVPALIVLLLTLRVAGARLWGRVAFLLVMATMCGRVIEIHEIHHYWKAGDALTRAQLELTRPVPRGAGIFPVFRLPEAAEASAVTQNRPMVVT